MIGSILLFSVTGCSNEQDVAATTDQETMAEVSATLITTIMPSKREILIQHESVGRLESRHSPTIAAEVDARVLAVLADIGDRVRAGDSLVELDTTTFELERRAAAAEIKSLEAKIVNERRRVHRYQNLRKDNLLAEEQLDDSQAQLSVYEASLEAAKAKLDLAEDRLSKASIRAPVNGVVEHRFVAVGDFVKIGAPVFLLTDDHALRALLPLPETLAYQLEVGQTVTLESPTAPGLVHSARIADLKPMIGRGSRAITATVDLENPGGWRPEATVIGRVVVGRRSNAILVPENAIVRRPVGEVVYVIDHKLARQQSVTLGEWIEGWVEIREGLDGTETIALEGAAFLSDGAAVRVAEASL